MAGSGERFPIEEAVSRECVRSEHRRIDPTRFYLAGRAALLRLHLQVLTKFPHHAFAQEIGIEFPAFCELDDPLRSFFGKIALIAKLKSFARHFECQADDSPGLAIELAIVQILCNGHGPASRLSSERTMRVVRVTRVTGRKARNSHLPDATTGRSSRSTGGSEGLAQVTPALACASTFERVPRLAGLR